MAEVVRILLRDEFSAQLKAFENNMRGFTRSVGTRRAQDEFRALERTAYRVSLEFGTVLRAAGVGSLISGTIVGSLGLISKALENVTREGLQTQYMARELNITVEQIRDLTNRAAVLGLEKGQAHQAIRQFYIRLEEVRRLGQDAPAARALQELIGGERFVDAVRRAMSGPGGIEAGFQMVIEKAKTIREATARRMFIESWGIPPQFADILDQHVSGLRKAIDMTTPAMIAFRVQYVNLLTSVRNITTRIAAAFLPTFERLLHTIDNWLQSDPGKQVLERIEAFAKYLEDLPWREIEQSIRKFFTSLGDIVSQTAGIIVAAHNMLQGLADPSAFEKSTVAGLITWLSLSAVGLRGLGKFAGLMVFLTGWAMSVKPEGAAEEKTSEGGPQPQKQPVTDEERRVGSPTTNMPPLQFAAGAGAGGMTQAMGLGDIGGGRKGALPNFEETVHLQESLRSSAQFFSQQDQLTTRELDHFIELTTNEFKRLNDFLFEKQIGAVGGGAVGFAAGVGGDQSRLGQLLGVTGAPRGPQYAALPPTGGVAPGVGPARGGGVLPPTPTEAPPAAPAAPAGAPGIGGAAGIPGLPGTPSGPAPRAPAAPAPGPYGGGAAGIPGLPGGPSGPAAPRSTGVPATAGGSAYLAMRRAHLFAELDRDPALRQTVARLIATENHSQAPGARAAIMERMVNAAIRDNKSLHETVYSGFYGPINRKQLRTLNAADMAVSEREMAKVKGGSDIIELRTDQGMINEHPYARRVGAGPARLKNINGEWYSDQGAGSRQWSDAERARQRAYDAAQPQQAAPGQADVPISDTGPRGRTATGTGSYLPENARMVAGANLKNVDPILLEAMKAGSAALPEGYSLRPTSGHRRGDPGFHGRGLASDWQIIGPDGKALPNRGWGATETELHGRVARAAYGWLLKNYPKHAERFEWGGAFPTGKSGVGPPDLMHYDFGGRRGRWAERQVQRMGPLYPPTVPQQQQADQPPSRPVGALAPISFKGLDTDVVPGLSGLLAKERAGFTEPKAQLDVTVRAPRDTKVEVNGDGAFKGNTSVTREMPPMPKAEDATGGGVIESPA
jgi:hypothetical protein